MITSPDTDPGENFRNVGADQVVEDIQRRHGSGFYRLARSKGICHLDALDIVQTSLLSLRQRLIDKGPVEDDLTYFAAVVRHQISQFFRDRRNAKEQPVDGVEELLPRAWESGNEQVVELGPHSESLMLRAANLAIQELSEHLREVYELAVYGQLEPSEIAQILKKKSATVRVYLFKARRQVDERAKELLAELEQQREVQKYCGEK